ncbi:siderophore-interacting protein [Pseudomonas aeruginosa]|nr:hypothetical protein Q055_02655 [Pseudomonas aeruginosa BL01]QLD68842.1 siderophore-interacting protein [Pseudomonas aeruginosa]QLD77073.1 siderophore-interacting protein [Pseudomonas aeruginosa]QLD81463.1 siderophore-interacting protein [Pseudomonas aeruginosa]
MSLAETLARNLRDLTHHAGLAKVPSYRLFDLVLKRRSPLSPSLVRFTFGGPEIARVRTLAPDQRVKLLFPAADGSLSQLPATGDWRRQVRSLEARRRPPMRTYTIRALRREAGEVDIDFVLHGETGPASRWAAHARPGERLVMSAPDGEYSGDPGGYEWRPPKDIRHILLIGDETALPASQEYSRNSPTATSGRRCRPSSRFPGNRTDWTYGVRRKPNSTGWPATWRNTSTARKCSAQQANWPLYRKPASHSASAKWISTGRYSGNWPSQRTESSMPGLPVNRQQ